MNSHTELKTYDDQLLCERDLAGKRMNNKKYESRQHNNDHGNNHSLLTIRPDSVLFWVKINAYGSVQHLCGSCCKIIIGIPKVIKLLLIILVSSRHEQNMQCNESRKREQQSI